MKSDIRESLDRLERIPPTDLKAAGEELTTLLAALRTEVESRISVLNTADSTHPTYSTAANNLVGLLQLTQAAAASRKEVDKLVFSAGKAIGRVLKKAPK